MDIKNITDQNMLDEALSAEKALLYKNSTRCPISRNAKGQFELFSNCDISGVDLYMVNVIEEQKLSMEAAERTGVTHKSPQLIYLEKGEAIWSMSHFEIKCENIEEKFR